MTTRDEELSSPQRPRRQAAARVVRYTENDDDDDDGEGEQSVSDSEKENEESAESETSFHVDDEDEEEELIEVEEDEEVVEDVDEADDGEDDEEQHKEEEDREEDDDDEKESRPKKKAKTARAKEFDEKCEYCGKLFKQEHGLSYHLENKVCRKVSAGRRKKSEASGKGFPRIRGKQEDRTCPHCGKTFTSTLGCQYHVQKGVCLKKKASPAIPLATLQPGLKFITPFGVVEVVSDDRAVPLAPDANDGEKDQSGGTDDMVTGDEKNDGKTAEQSGKKRKKSSAPNASTAYRKAVATRNTQAGRLRSTVTVMSMARRKELTRAYQEGKIDQQSVWAIQYGRDPRRIPSWQHARFPEVKPVVMEDPSAPSSSFPDRIVVCRWVKDERDRFLGTDKELPTLDSPPRRPDDRPTLFLQRRMLTSPLGEGAACYMCPTCGQNFLSKAGALYHQERSKCTEGRNSSDQSTNLIKSWDSKAINILRRKELRQAESQPALAATMSDVGSDRKVSPIPVPPPTPRPTVKPSSMAETVNIKEEPAIPEVKVLAKTRKEKKMELSAKPDFVDPRKVLADLEMELRLQQSIMIGPVYPSVYKALQFQKPGSKKKRQRRTKQEIEREEEREAIAKAIQKEKEAIARLAKLRSRIVFTEQKTTTPVTVAVENAPEPALPLQQSPGKGGLKVEVTNAENEPNEISGRDANKKNPLVRPDASQTTTLRPINEKPEVHARDTHESSTPVPEQEELTDSTILNSPEIPGLKRSDLQKEEGLKVNKLEQETKGSMTTRLAVKKPDFEYRSFLCSLPDRPPMIDTRVLVQEIDAGRYPSINRRAAQKPDKGQYAGKCTICRTAQPVLQKCNFCPRSVHMACARLKYTLPDPEPYDDFLCNVCIQAITHRRNRAERRRIERMMGVEVAATTPSVTEMKHPQIPLHRDAPRQLEYEAVVSQGRHMSNLVDLEADARMRLQREMEHSKLNEIRRQMMML